MNPEKPSEPFPLPEGASPELRKLAAEADDILKRMEDDGEQIEADVQKIEKVEKDLRNDYL
jgi:hypothetical protein